MHDYIPIVGAALFALCSAVTLFWMMRNLLVSVRREGMSSLFETENYLRRSFEVLLRPFLFFMASSILIWLIFFGWRLLFTAEVGS